MMLGSMIFGTEAASPEPVVVSSTETTLFTFSGGTVTWEGKLAKWLIFNSSFTMGMTCDANGNISFT